MKIGLCTGGGDCPGLNAVIRAVVRHAIGTYNAEVWGIVDSFNGLMTRPLEVRKLTIGEVTDILERGGTILGTTNAGNPFNFDAAHPTGEGDHVQAVIKGYKDLGLNCIIVIGGDGTQSIASKFCDLGLNLIGVPKTIDNDQAATDLSVGFQTAVDTASDAISKLRSTAESHDRVMVLELMGRDAGHIALHAGIAGGANVILLPEIPFDMDSIVAKVEERRKLGRYFSIVVVAEGAYEKGKEPVYLSSKHNTKYATRHLGGIGSFVAERLHEITKMDTRITVLGHVQRGGSPNPFDRVLGTAFGVYAVDLAVAKKFGVVVGMRKNHFVSTPYKDVLDVTSPVALDSFYIHTAEATGICLGRKSKYVSRAVG